LDKKIFSYMFILGLVGITFTNLTVNISSLSSPVYIIDDFSGFSSYHDTDLVNSTLDESMITMIHNNEPGEIEWETFFNGFGDIDDYTNFDIELYFNYTYTGSMLMQVSLMLGSYYFENGTYDGEFPANYRDICSCTIWDPWSASDGKYVVNARPYNIKEVYDTPYGTLSPSGTLQFKITRVNNTLDLSILKDGVVQLQHQWSQGLTRPLSYLYLALSIDPSYCTNTEVIFTSIFAELDTTTARPSFPSLDFGFTTNIICLLVILNLGAILGIRKMRKR